MSKEKIKPTPFEMAKTNINTAAQNFNMYSSVIMLTDAIKKLDELSEAERKEMHEMFNNVIIQMSEYFLESGEKWN